MLYVVAADLMLENPAPQRPEIAEKEAAPQKSNTCPVCSTCFSSVLLLLLLPLLLLPLLTLCSSHDKSPGYL
jgi:hypothetical protein